MRRCFFPMMNLFHYPLSIIYFLFSIIHSPLSIFSLLQFVADGEVHMTEEAVDVFVEFFEFEVVEGGEFEAVSEGVVLGDPAVIVGHGG